MEDSISTATLVGFKAEQELKEKYQSTIDSLDKTQCITYLECVARKEIARANLMKAWKNRGNSENIDLSAEQEFAVKKLVFSSGMMQVASLRTQLADAVRTALVQDEIVRRWITEDC
jgi:hypothetical protein